MFEFVLFKSGVATVENSLGRLKNIELLTTIKRYL